MPTGNTPTSSSDAKSTDDLDASVDGDDPCANCGQSFRGTYCSHCGQRRFSGRFTLRGVLSRLVAEVFYLDRGLFPTLGGLTINPGRMVQEYWSGRTQRYLNPIRYFLLAVAIAQITAWQLGVIDAFAAGFAEGAEETFFSRSDAAQFIGEYFVVLIGMGLPLTALTAHLFTRRTLAEHLIFSLFVFAHIGLLFSLAVLFHDPLSDLLGADDRASLVFAALMAVYYVWASVNAFEQPAVRGACYALGTLAVSLLAYLFLAGLVIGFIGAMSR